MIFVRGDHWDPIALSADAATMAIERLRHARPPRFEDGGDREARSYDRDVGLRSRAWAGVEAATLDGDEARISDLSGFYHTGRSIARDRSSQPRILTIRRCDSGPTRLVQCCEISDLDGDCLARAWDHVWMGEIEVVSGVGKLGSERGARSVGRESIGDRNAVERERDRMVGRERA